MRKSSRLLYLSLSAFLIIACSKKQETGTPTEDKRTVPVANQEKTTAPVAAPPEPQAPTAPSAPKFDGEWSGDAGDPNLPVSFAVQDNAVNGFNASYSGKNGSCSFNGSFGSDETATLQQNSFRAKGKSPRDEIYFNAKGTLLSATEASGTLEFKGTSALCGEFNLQYKWTAKKVPGDYGE